ncbi:MAG: 3-methyl-2-oxobutanoate hydroxymethyltransferase [Candidatus Hodarchaeales archaeon]|jgi:3-methyl-2-oxobutanoate hydroxymethyltransferase
MMQKVTTTKIAQSKNIEPFTMLTAYDYLTAKIFDQAGIDILLIGDSMGNVVYGYNSTIPVTLEQMIYHCQAVSNGAKTHSLIVGDMPFLTFGVKSEKTVENAGRLIKEGGAEAIKLEGGTARVEETKACIDVGIPVMGHIGLTPQSIHKFGGHKVQGRTADMAEYLIQEAHALVEAGVFSIVLEAVPWQVSKVITEQIPIPTIGIGAGPYCDGQVLVWPDALGLFDDFIPKFVKRFANLKENIIQAVDQYKTEVKNHDFPSLKHSYEMPAEELEKWERWDPKQQSKFMTDQRDLFKKKVTN